MHRATLVALVLITGLSGCVEEGDSDTASPPDHTACGRTVANVTFVCGAPLETLPKQAGDGWSCAYQESFTERFEIWQDEDGALGVQFVSPEGWKQDGLQRLFGDLFLRVNEGPWERVRWFGEPDVFIPTQSTAQSQDVVDVEFYAGSFQLRQGPENRTVDDAVFYDSPHGSGHRLILSFPTDPPIDAPANFMAVAGEQGTMHDQWFYPDTFRFNDEAGEPRIVVQGGRWNAAFSTPLPAAPLAPLIDDRCA